MTSLPSRTSLEQLTCFLLLVPGFLYSQVIIREKVEIRPKLTPKFSMTSDSLPKPVSYFDPPSLVLQDGLPTVTLTSRLEVRGEIDQEPVSLLPNEHVVIAFMQGSPEYAIRSIGRDPGGSGGSPYSRDTPFAGEWGKGGRVDCRMYGFNSNVWIEAQREINLLPPDSSLQDPVATFSYRAEFYRHQAPSLWITGRAMAAAAILPKARLTRWEVRSDKIRLSNDERAYIEFTSFDGTGALYWPIRIPGAVAPVTVKVRAKGPYAYLEGANEQGELTVQLLDWSGGYSPMNQVELVFDPRRGKVPDNRDTATVLLSGGGKSDSVQVELVYDPLDHLTVELEREEVTYGEGTAVTVIAKDVNDQEAEIDTTRRVVISVVPGGGGGGAAKLTQKIQPDGSTSSVNLKLQGRTTTQESGSRPKGGSFVVEGADTIPDQVTVPYGIARGGKVKYVANGQVPYGAGPEPVTIRAEAVDEIWKFGEVGVMIKGEDVCPIVEFAKRRIAPGDTVRVPIKGKKADGTLVEYRSEREFDISISKGAEFGVLRYVNWDETGSSFERATQPFEFIAVDSLTVDSAVVQITGYPSPSDGGEEEIPASVSGGGDRARQGVSLKKGSDEKEVASAAVARLLSANECETAVDTLVIKATRLDHFEVRSEQDTVAFTEATRLFVRAKDVNDQDVELDGNQLLMFSIDSTQYGSFIAADGDTVPSPLANVSYGNAKNGTIQFAAVKRSPHSTVACLLRVELQADPSKKGDTTIVVVEQTLRIVMNEPYEARPSIPTEDNDANMARLRRKPFEVRMTPAGKAVANHPFRLRTDYVRESGGHDHTNTRNTVRADNNDNYGYFLWGQPEQEGRPLENVTNGTGRFAVTYHSSMFGDTMKIYLESRNNSLLRDSISVVERVPDLILLPESPDYTQIGGTQEHHGPPLYGRREDNHNHYGTAEVNRSIANLAAQFRRAFPRQPVLAINDMSLPLGGRFDINGQWEGNTEHEFHRNGVDVDIRSSQSTMAGDRFLDRNRNDEYDAGIDRLVLDRNGNGEYDNEVHPQFTRICTNTDGVFRVRLEFPGQTREHFHLYFWNVGTQ